LQIDKQPSEVKNIWHTRDDDLDPLPSWRWSFDHETDMEGVEQRELLQKILEQAHLSERFEIVIRMVTIEEATLEDAARELGVTKERARQMHIQALRRLRSAQFKITGISPWKVYQEVTTWRYYSRMQRQIRQESGR
jgi:DNA-directed RNA polymerase specialized sigma subunit